MCPPTALAAAPRAADPRGAADLPRGGGGDGGDDGGDGGCGSRRRS